MHVRIRSQYFTDERGKDSTIVVAAEDATREEINALGECMGLVVLAANQCGGARGVEMFRDVLRGFVLDLFPFTPPASSAPSPVREPSDDSRLNVPDDLGPRFE